MRSFAALASPIRLAVFRQLVAAGPDGLPAGEIARRLNLLHNTLSAHLADLSDAGLVRSRRDGRSIIYSADLDGLARIVGFLVNDCCGGRPELCGEAQPLIARIVEATRQERDTAMAAGTYNVLFLCTGNSARSIMAEAILSRLSMNKGKFRAFSAGSRPKGEIHPEARALLTKLGYDVSWMRSKSWDEFARPGSPQMDFVFTVCDDAAGEQCPVWPGHPMTAHWGVLDPSAVEGTPAEIAAAFAEAYRLLNNRISVFVELPLHALDRLSLHRKLREIGEMEGASPGSQANASATAAE